MNPFENGFDFVKFVNEGFERQTKYAKKAGDPYTPEDLNRIDKLIAIGGSETKEEFAEALKFRYAKIIEFYGHLAEEAIESRVYVPRRSWKNEEVSYMDSEELRKEYIAEIFDMALFLRCILVYSGVSGEEFAEVAAEKTNYNTKRKDHAINGNAAAQRDVAAELQGNCESSKFGFNAG